MKIELRLKSNTAYTYEELPDLERDISELCEEYSKKEDKILHIIVYEQSTEL